MFQDFHLVNLIQQCRFPTYGIYPPLTTMSNVLVQLF